MALDFSTEFGQRAERRLRGESVIWLTTVSADLTPQTRPVWFLWDGETLLIFSREGSFKQKHLEQRPRVSLNFDSNGRGGDIVVLTGDAEITSPVAEAVAAFGAKYAEGFKQIGMSADAFTQAYPVAIRVRPMHLRGH